MTSYRQRVVITGGPGSGKSSLLQALGQKGFECSIEAGRGVIQDQVLIGGSALPWTDRQAFAELMLCWEMRSWHDLDGSNGPCFYDRGVPDIAGYLSLCGLPIPEHLEKAIEHFRYAETVFIAPPWRDIYVQDAERKQSFVEAELTYQSMVVTYRKNGYRLLELPLAPVQDRVDFVLNHLGLVKG